MNSSFPTPILKNIEKCADVAPNGKLYFPPQIKGPAMKRLHVIKGLLLAATLTVTGVHAVIIEGSFNGTVRSFSNGVEEVNFKGYWDNVSEGVAASGSFWYDTEKAPKNTSDFTTSSFYQSYTDDWIGSHFNIDGKTYDISALPLLERYVTPSEGIWLFNFEPAVDGSTKERFNIFDNISTGDFAGGSRSVGLMVEITSEEKPMLSGLGVNQEFDWYSSNDPTSYGQAYFSIGTSAAGEQKESSAWIDISEFHLSVKNTATVPEPSSLALWLSVFALLLTRLFSAKCKRM